MVKLRVGNDSARTMAEIMVGGEGRGRGLQVNWCGPLRSVLYDVRIPASPYPPQICYGDYQPAQILRLNLSGPIGWLFSVQTI